jgi:hypothetical protein
MPHRSEPLVAIAVFRSDFDAGVARGALEAIGIPARVPGVALGMLSRNRGGIPEGTLQVFASDKDAAVAELRRKDFQIVGP